MWKVRPLPAPELEVSGVITNGETQTHARSPKMKVLQI